jgi:hypothetical protein
MMPVMKRSMSGLLITQFALVLVASILLQVPKLVPSLSADPLLPLFANMLLSLSLVFIGMSLLLLRSARFRRRWFKQGPEEAESGE